MLLSSATVPIPILTIEVFFTEKDQYAICDLELTRKSNNNERQTIRIKNYTLDKRKLYVCLKVHSQVLDKFRQLKAL